MTLRILALVALLATAGFGQVSATTGSQFFPLGCSVPMTITNDTVNNQQIGACYYQLGEHNKIYYKKAQNSFARARSDSYETADLYRYWALAFSKQGKMRDAARKLKECYDVKPDESICVLAARYYINEKLHKSAEDILQRGLEDFPESKRIRDLIPLVRN